MGALGIGCLSVIGLFMLVLIIGSLSGGSNSSRSSRQMSVDVGWGFDMIRIKNTGSVDAVGQNMTVYLNGMPPFAYKAEWPVPAVGETALIPLGAFAKGESRFDARTQAVSEAWIGGAGYDYVQYRK
jgi:hypothetical protein